MIRHVKQTRWLKPVVVLLIGLLLMTPQIGWAMPVLNTGSEASTPKAPQAFTVKKSVFVPGDAVEISVFPDTTSFLNQVFPIDDRGYIDLPIIGKVKITDMSKQEFIEFIQENFKDYLRYPYIVVRPMIRISVLGGVPRPGFYYVDPDMTLWEVMHRVGGTLDEEGLKEMRWERDRKIIQKDLIPYLQKGTSLRTMGFRSGDQIWVKTPGKPGLMDKILRYMPVVTMFTTLFTLYYTYQRTILIRR
ncbi:MAG: hypothetical protein GXO78_02965 [Calditrichaeota bacterium]|nr:hypothetical protein [Calditrichota bacterium]